LVDFSGICDTIQKLIKCGDTMDDLIFQYLDRNAGWINCGTIADGARMNPSSVQFYAKDMQKMYPNNRLRSIDENGRLIDLYY